tara:strand:+ start:50 stop:346 length:297 start_codon:yes stop_codon:yes gene_type:complete
MTKETKKNTNKNSGTITAAIGGVVVGAAATKLLSNNNNVRKYTKEEANFRNNNGLSKSCATCKHSQPSNKINSDQCNIVSDVEDLLSNICDYQISRSD